MSGATIIISPASGIPVTGLTFASNNEADSNTAFEWSGAAMLPRFLHTELWKVIYTDQLGYYAFNWYALATRAWGGGTTRWERGAHPHPSDGSVNAEGYATGGTGSSGAVHYHEIANGSDKISNGGSPLQVVKGVELWQMVTCEQVLTDYVHRFYPDLQGNPSFYIEWIEPVASVAADPGVIHRYGSTPWDETGTAENTGDTSGEASSGSYWHFLQYNAVKTVPQALAKFALTNNDTTDPDIWYSNISPTPTDIDDKSGQGHHPAWRGSNRPGLYDPP